MRIEEWQSITILQTPNKILELRKDSMAAKKIIQSNKQILHCFEIILLKNKTEQKSVWEK